MNLDRNSTTSEFLHQLFLQKQLDLVPEIELSSNDLLIDLAKIGLGIAFIPDYCLTEKTDDLFVVKLKENLPSRQIAISANTVFPLSAAAERFLELFPAL